MNFNEEDYESQNEDNLSVQKQLKLGEGKPTLKCATPSVIRKGLCMVRDKGNQQLYTKDMYSILRRGKNEERLKL